jgi:hypothetical protein
MVGAISDDGLSGLLNFTNIFSAMRCSFRPGSCVPSTSTPLGRGVQHPNPISGALQRNGTKGQSGASDPVPPCLHRSTLSASPVQSFCGMARRAESSRGNTSWKRGFYERNRWHDALWDIVSASKLDAPAYLLAVQREPTTIRLPGKLAQTVQLGGTFV